MYLIFPEFWRVGVVVQWWDPRDWDTKVRVPSVLEMAATFNERDNYGGAYLSGLYKGVPYPPPPFFSGPTGPCKICSLIYQEGFWSYRVGASEALPQEANTPAVWIILRSNSGRKE